MRRAKRGNLSRSETRRARQRARWAGATHLPSTCKHWQVIVVVPARGGFVFISRRRATKLNSAAASRQRYPRLLRSALRTELPTPRCLRPSWGGASDGAALITPFTTLRSFSLATYRRSLNAPRSIACQNSGSGLQTNLPTATRLRGVLGRPSAAPPLTSLFTTRILRPDFASLHDAAPVV